MHGEGVIVFPNNKIFRGTMENGRCKKGNFEWIVEPVQNKPTRFCLHIFDDESERKTSGKSIPTPSAGTTPRSFRENSPRTTIT